MTGKYLKAGNTGIVEPTSGIVKQRRAYPPGKSKMSRVTAPMRACQKNRAGCMQGQLGHRVEDKSR